MCHWACADQYHLNGIYRINHHCRLSIKMSLGMMIQLNLYHLLSMTVIKYNVLLNLYIKRVPIKLFYWVRTGFPVWLSSWHQLSYVYAHLRTRWLYRLGGSSPSSLVTQTVISHHSELKHGQVCCFHVWSIMMSPKHSKLWLAALVSKISSHCRNSVPTQFLKLFSRKFCKMDLTVWLLQKDHLLRGKLPYVQMKFRDSCNGLHHIQRLTVAATKDTEKVP